MIPRPILEFDIVVGIMVWFLACCAAVGNATKIQAKILFPVRTGVATHAMKCIVCNSQMLEQKSWLYVCNSCGFASSTFDAGSGRGVEGLEKLRRMNFANLCNRLDKHYSLAGKTLLEVGCAEGWFLEEAQRRRMLAHAIEPSPLHAQMARSKGFDVTTGFFPFDLPQPGHFDFIVFNDVFEHLPDPISAVKHCEELLSPRGVLVLNLPSNLGVIYRIGSVLARLGYPSTLERLWQKGFPSPHLNYYNPVTLQRFVIGQTKLQHVETFQLDSIITDGLIKRVEASHPGYIGRIISLSLVIALPVVKILPPDIIVGIFEKHQAG